MAQYYRKISGELTQQLIQAGASTDVVKMSFTNIHADTACTLDLFIEKKLKGRFYLLKSVNVPVGATLIYENGIVFSTKKNQFGLFMKLTKTASETPTVDVILQ